jgi:predicted transcriptional regulator
MIDPAVEAEITSRLQEKKRGQTVDELHDCLKRPKEVVLQALHELRERGFVALKEGVWMTIPWEPK